MSRSDASNSRAAAAGLIRTWLRSGRFPDRLLRPDEPNHSFVMALVYGTVRRKRALEWLADRVVNRPPPDTVRPLLLVGLQQVFFLDDVADHAAVHETVEAARCLKLSFATGFLNGVLRRCLREREALLHALRKQPLAIRESHPDLLVDRWCTQWGDVEVEALCRWNNADPAVTVRARGGPDTFQALQEALREAGIDAQPHRARPDEFLELAHGSRVEDLPGFSEGRFCVQDPSTATAVDLLQLEPGLTVLDLCAAPGGKTALVADRMNGTGRITALDRYDDRLALLRDTLNRLNIANVEVLRADAARQPNLAKALGGRTFDRILLDVPCTNTGVLRRRVDARWRFSRKRLRAMAALQRQLLDAAAGFLAPGGILVYSTCSLEPEEGARLVGEWSHATPGYETIEERLLFPPHSGTDGAYAAAARRQPA